MVVDANELAGAIGARVRQARTDRHWTLDELAERAGVSRRMIVNVEQGSVNPSIGTLLRLSDALGIGLPALVNPSASTAAKVTRAGRGAALWTGEHGGRGVLVAGTEPPDVTELWDWTLGPGDRHQSEAHSAGTVELLHVLDGSVTVEVSGRPHLLEPGDALTFHGDTEHSYTNPHDTPARFTLCVHEPGVGKPKKWRALMTDPQTPETFLAACEVSPAVLELRPDYRALLIVVSGLDPLSSSPSADDLVGRAEAHARELIDSSPVEELDHIAASEFVKVDEATGSQAAGW